MMMRVTTPSDGDQGELEEILRALADPDRHVRAHEQPQPVRGPCGCARGHFGRLSVEIERRLGGPVAVVSRSDSTLRGHLIAEVHALDEGRREADGRGYDGILLVPAYLEAGRFTAGDIQWARIGGDVLAVGETEFAKDPTFGYVNSNLRYLLEEKSGGAIEAGSVVSVSLEDVRSKGCERRRGDAAGPSHGRFAVVNAASQSDLETVALAVATAEEAGSSLLVRKWAFLCRSLGRESSEFSRSPRWTYGRPGDLGVMGSSWSAHTSD